MPAAGIHTHGDVLVGTELRGAANEVSIGSGLPGAPGATHHPLAAEEGDRM